MFGRKSQGREKRKHQRVERRFVVMMRVKNDAPKSWDVVGLENVSEGGILFNHDAKIQNKTLLDLKIKIHSDKPPIECTAKIVHLRKLGELELYEYGVCFAEIKPIDLAYLRKSLQN